MPLNAALSRVPGILSSRILTDFPDPPCLCLQRLMAANPNSFRKLVATFLEANGRGYWEAKPEQLEKLRQLYMDVEDKIEGVE